jgi:hypothetical protein
MEVPQKDENKTVVKSSNLITGWVYIQRHHSQYVKELPACPCLLQNYSQ